MADTKKAGAAGAANVNTGSILGNYLPEGFSEKDIVVTGELPPQYLGKQHLERARALNLSIDQIPPLVGLYDRVEVLPIQERDKGQDFCPYSLLIRDVKNPVIGFRGKEEKRVEVSVDVGGKILLPVTGAVGVNREIMDMVRDLDGTYLVGARPIGEEKVNDQPSKMIKWRIEVVKLKTSRAELGGQWALPAWYVLLIATGDMLTSIKEREHIGLLKMAYEDGIDVTPSGNVINRKTGLILGSMGSNGRYLPEAAKPAEAQSLVS